MDYAIIGSAAIDPDGALLDYDFREVRVAQAIIGNARHVVLVADRGKLERSAPVRIGQPARCRHHRHRPISRRRPPCASLCPSAKKKIRVVETQILPDDALKTARDDGERL